MRSQRIWYLGLLVALVVALTARVEARGGGGRRGGGLFSSWRKVKKPSSSSTSSRRHHGGSSDGGSLGHLGSSGNKGYKPLKSATQPKAQAAHYPRQPLPPGAVHHASGASLPAGAAYHPYSTFGAGAQGAGTGGTYYANAAALPPGAILYAQAPQQSSFNPANFIFGMYAAQMLSHGVFGHRPLATNVYHDNPPAEDRKDRIIVIENGAAQAAPGSSNAAMSFSPADSEVQPNPLEQVSSSALPPAQAGIVCVPLLLNETDPDDAAQVVQVERIVCYPVPAAPAAGIICVPRPQQEANSNSSESSEMVEEAATEVAQDCYPAAPPAAVEGENSTPSPESVIGNISNEPDDSEQTHAVLETLRQEEQKTMGDFFGSFESRGLTQ